MSKSILYSFAMHIIFLNYKDLYYIRVQKGRKHADWQSPLEI